MQKKDIHKNLQNTYLELLPFSNKYKIDFDRFLFSLLILNDLDIKNKKILDVGTGIGIIPLTLNKLGAQAIGIDYYIFPENNNQMFKQDSISELEKIWEKNNTQIFNADIYNPSTALGQNQFDIIISEATIEHLKNPKEYIAKCCELLKTDGYLLISTPNISKLLNRLRFLFGKAPNWPIEEFYNAGENFTGHWREYTIKELKTMCKISDLKNINTYNKNILYRFHGLAAWKKNLRAAITWLANIIPGAGDMNYILCQKKSTSPHQSIKSDQLN